MVDQDLLLKRSEKGLATGNQNEHRYWLTIAFTEGIRDYMVKTLIIWKLKLVAEGTDIQKYYDPRKWIRESEVTFNSRLEQAFADLNNVNTL
jgi:fructose-bisphosphate aldolase class II